MLYPVLFCWSPFCSRRMLSCHGDEAKERGMTEHQCFCQVCCQVFQLAAQDLYKLEDCAMILLLLHKESTI